MFEKLQNNKKLATLAVTLGLGTIGMAGCSTGDGRGEWKFAVNCPPTEDVVQIGGVSRYYSDETNVGTAKIQVFCGDTTPKLSSFEPVGIQLVDGDGTKVLENIPSDGTVTVKYVFDDGDIGDDTQTPAVRSISSRAGLIELEGIKSIDEVSVSAGQG